MKIKTNLFLCVLFSMVAYVNSFAQKYDSPIAYMSALSEQYEQISKEQWDYTKAVAKGKKARTIEKKRLELAKTIKNAKKSIARMPDYEGDTQLRDSVVSYLGLSYNMINEDYARIIDLEEVAEQSYDDMEAYLLAKELVNEKQKMALEKLNSVESDFAKTHNITLTEEKTKLGKKLANANEVFTYYNDVYLLFFKSYKQEVYYLEAMAAGDLAAMEQNRNALSSYSKEAMGKLRAFENYQGDASLKQACMQVLRFLQKEADKELPKLNDFMVKKDNFEKIKQAVEAKGGSKTQEDVDQYNSALEAYNKGVNGFNNTNNRLNDQRERAFKKWNDVVDRFLGKHIL
jgi:hypothetical protein